MFLRNFEREFGSGGPISGALIEIYVATLTAAPGAPVSFTDHNLVFGPSTTSSPEGLWEARDLPDGQYYDVKVTYNSNIKWYKGRSKHIVEHLYDDTTPDPNRNLLPNGGQDLINVNGVTAPAIAVVDPGDVQGAGADGWNCYGGAGDSGTVQATNAVRAANSVYAMKISYNRAGGTNQCHYNKFIPEPVWQQLRGKTVTVSFEVFQETLSSGCHAYVTDGLTTVLGTPTASVGSYVTISATMVVSTVATLLRCGVRTNRVNTGNQNFYVDNGVLDIGSVTPVFAAEMIESGPSVIYHTINDSLVPVNAGGSLGLLLNNLANRVKAITGKASWVTSPVSSIETLKTVADALAATVSALSASLTAGLALKVAKAGDTMTGTLTMAPTNRLRFSEDASHTWDFVASGGEFFLAANISGGGTPQLKLNTSTLFFWDGTAFRPFWHSNNDGPGSGLDSDLLDSQQGTFYLARANHTGTQLAATISDFSATVLALASALGHGHPGIDAGTLDGIDSTGFATSGHSHSYGNASCASVTYVGNGSGANRNIALGVSVLPMFAFFQMVAGGSNTMIVANHDGITIQPGGPGFVGPVLIGASFGVGIVTVPPGTWNTGGITYRVTVFGT